MEAKKEKEVHDLTKDIEPLKNKVFFVQKIFETYLDFKDLISCKIENEDAEEKLFKFSENDFKKIKENFKNKGGKRFRWLQLENDVHDIYIFKNF